MTFVVHAFMDADVVEGGVADDGGRDRPRRSRRSRPRDERLQACSYAMAHPETGRIVPACVQHSVLDPGENRRLADVAADGP